MSTNRFWNPMNNEPTGYELGSNNLNQPNVASKSPNYLVQCSDWFPDNSAIADFPNSVVAYNIRTSEIRNSCSNIGFAAKGLSRLYGDGQVLQYGILVTMPIGAWTPLIRANLHNCDIIATLSLHRVTHIMGMTVPLRTITCTNNIITTCNTEGDMMSFSIASKTVTDTVSVYDETGNQKGTVGQKTDYIQGLSEQAK